MKIWTKICLWGFCPSLKSALVPCLGASVWEYGPGVEYGIVCTVRCSCPGQLFLRIILEVGVLAARIADVRR